MALASRTPRRQSKTTRMPTQRHRQMGTTACTSTWRPTSARSAISLGSASNKLRRGDPILSRRKAGLIRRGRARTKSTRCKARIAFTRTRRGPTETVMKALFSSISSSNSRRLNSSSAAGPQSGHASKKLVLLARTGAVQRARCLEPSRQDSITRMDKECFRVASTKNSLTR